VFKQHSKSSIHSYPVHVCCYNHICISRSHGAFTVIFIISITIIVSRPLRWREPQQWMHAKPGQCGTVSKTTSNGTKSSQHDVVNQLTPKYTFFSSSSSLLSAYTFYTNYHSTDVTWRKLTLPTRRYWPPRLNRFMEATASLAAWGVSYSMNP